MALPCWDETGGGLDGCDEDGSGQTAMRLLSSAREGRDGFKRDDKAR